MKLGGRFSEPARLTVSGAWMSVSWTPPGLILLMVTLSLASNGFSAQPIKVAAGPGTSSGSVTLVDVNSQPAGGRILRTVVPLLVVTGLMPSGAGKSGKSGLHWLVHGRGGGEDGDPRKTSPSCAKNIDRGRCHPFAGCA